MRVRELIGGLFLAACSIAGTALALELGARAYKREWRIINFAGETHDLFRAAYPAEYDAELGWVPKPGRFSKNVWNTTVTIQPDGTRSTTIHSHSDRDGVLALGDSFTFGDEVSDAETWPAVLERFAGVPVVNGGVFGYGIDQAYLRMRDLTSRFRPRMIVFSLIPADTYRCEDSERTSVPKPYFQLSSGDGLTLHAEHVRAYQDRGDGFGFFRTVGGYSFLLHKLMARAAPERWLQGSMVEKKAHSDGVEVACRLLKTLGTFGRDNDATIYLLVQYPSAMTADDRRIATRLLACIDDSVTAVDLGPRLAAIKASDPARFETLFYGEGHMTPEGNRLVAEELWKAMKAR